MLNDLIVCVGTVENTIANRSKLCRDFDTLDERSQQVLKYRHGDKLTLVQAGERMGCSGGRVRQIQAKALRVLREKTVWW